MAVLSFRHRKAARKKAAASTDQAPGKAAEEQDARNAGEQEAAAAEAQQEAPPAPKKRAVGRKKAGEQLDVVNEVERKEREEAAAREAAEAESAQQPQEGAAEATDKEAEEKAARRRAGVEKRRATMAKKKAEREAAARKAAEEDATAAGEERKEAGDAAAAKDAEEQASEEHAAQEEAAAEAARQEEEARKAAEEKEARKRAAVEKRKATMAKKKAEREAAESGPKTIKATPTPPPADTGEEKADATQEGDAPKSPADEEDGLIDYLTNPTRKARDLDLPEEGQTLSQKTLVDLFHRKMSDPEFARKLGLVPIEKRSNSESVLRAGLLFIFEEIIPHWSCFVFPGVKIKQKKVEKRIHRIPVHKVTDPSKTHVLIEDRLTAEMRVHLIKGDSIYGTLDTNVDEIEYATPEERIEARLKAFVPSPDQGDKS